MYTAAGQDGRGRVKRDQANGVTARWRGKLETEKVTEEHMGLGTKQGTTIREEGVVAKQTEGEGVKGGGVSIIQ